MGYFFDKVKRKSLIIARQPLPALTSILAPSLGKVFDVKQKPYSLSNTLDLDGFESILSLCVEGDEILTVDEFLADGLFNDFVNTENTRKLEEFFRSHGSDKSTAHDYHRIYQPVIDLVVCGNAERDSLIAEIGLGTCYLDVQSNMGINGTPGASLRAFRSYSDRISLIGGDVDKRVLFSEDRIATHHVDQLNLESLDSFLAQGNFDIAIDDGLHIPRSNINFLNAFLKNSKSGSFAIIEDISLERGEFWACICRLLNDRGRAWLVRCKQSLLLVFRKS